MMTGNINIIIIFSLFLGLLPLTASRECYYVQEEPGQATYLTYDNGAIFGKDECDSTWEFDGSKFRTKTGFFCCKKYLGITDHEPGAQYSGDLVGKGSADNEDTWEEVVHADGTVSIKSKYLEENTGDLYYVTAVPREGQNYDFELLQKGEGESFSWEKKFYKD